MGVSRGGCLDSSGSLYVGGLLSINGSLALGGFLSRIDSLLNFGCLRGSLLRIGCLGNLWLADCTWVSCFERLAHAWWASHGFWLAANYLGISSSLARSISVVYSSYMSRCLVSGVLSIFGSLLPLGILPMSARSRLMGVLFMFGSLMAWALSGLSAGRKSTKRRNLGGLFRTCRGVQTAIGGSLHDVRGAVNGNYHRRRPRAGPPGRPAPKVTAGLLAQRRCLQRRLAGEGDCHVRFRLPWAIRNISGKIS